MESVLLIIEEDKGHSDLIVQCLIKDHYYVSCTFTAQEGLDSVYRRYPHLIIMDLNLSLMNGIEVIRKLKSDFETRTIPIIAISSDPKLREAALQAGAHAFLGKPIEEDELRAAIASVLRRKLKVLFVDDDVDILELLHRSFEKKYDILTSQDAEDAYQTYLKEDLNLIVTDIAMSELTDGIKLIKQIRKNDARTPIVVTSGICADQLKNCMQNGADNIMEKPFDVFDLGYTIQKVLKAHFPLSFEQKKP